jgi:hypothetical protein
VPEVGAQRVGVAVHQGVGERELVEGLVPELALGLGRQDALAHAGQRRRQDERAHGRRAQAGDRLRHAAADVVAGQHDGLEADLVDEREHARRLRVGGVRVRRRRVVAVRAAEAAQVGRDDVGVVAQERDDRAVVGPRAGPAVQQHDRGARALAVVLQGESVDGPAQGHGAAGGRWAGPTRS